MRVERRLAAIMAADVVGYSRLMGRDEEGTVRQIKSLIQTVIRPIVTEHRGRVVKTLGDGFLGEFASVVEAFECARKLQRAAAKRNTGVAGDKQIILRIGINVGDIIIDDNDVFGDGVIIAARLEGVAEPGGICVSARAWEDLRKLKVQFSDMGELKLKNIEPVRAFAYVPPPPAVPAVASATPTAGAAPAPAAPPPKAPAPVAAATPEVAATPMAALKTHWRIAAGCVAAVIALTAVGVSLVKKAPAPDPLAFVTAQIGQTPCSWLRVSDHSSVDGIEAYRLSGASSVQPAVISRNILRDAKARKVDVDQVIATDVAPLDPQRCGWIETLKPFRYAGIPRFELRLETMKRGVTRAELTFNAAELGPAGALYGVEPSGAVQRIVGRTELAKLGPPAVIHHDDGSYTLNVDTDRSGWNGIVFMESKTAAPQGLVELPLQSVAERQRFTNLARAGGWRFELAWFKVEP